MVHSNYAIVRQAADLQGIVDDVASSASQTWQDVNLRQRPFYTLFKYLAPSWLMFRGQWILAAFIALAEEFLGIGPSAIGAMIDSALGLGTAGGATEVSDAGLMEASKGVVDKVLGAAMMRSSAFEADVRKNGVTIEAMLAAWAAGPDAGLRKDAATARSRWARIKNWLVKVKKGQRMPLVAMIYSLLKKFVVAMGLFTGIKFVKKQLGFGRPESFGLPFGMPGAGKPGAPAGARLDPAAGFVEWKNIGGVERSIVAALDRMVKDRRGRPFSSLFADIQGHPLRGSSQMRRLLEDISMVHGWAPLRELDRTRYFMAPPVAETARRLLPQLKYSPGGRPGAEKIPERVPKKVQPPGPTLSGPEAVLGRILGGGKQ